MVLCLDPENEDLLAFETMLDGEVEVQGPEGAAAPTFAPPWVTEIKALQPQPLSPKTATRSVNSWVRATKSAPTKPTTP